MLISKRKLGLLPLLFRYYGYFEFGLKPENPANILSLKSQTQQSLNPSSKKVPKDLVSGATVFPIFKPGHCVRAQIILITSTSYLSSSYGTEKEESFLLHV